MLKNVWTIGLCAALTIFLASGASGSTFSARIVGKTLYFDGVIDEKSAVPLRKFVLAGGDTIVITSEGGEVAAGLSIAKALANSNTEVIVERYCLSSCANYIFLPARRKSLRDHAVLGFHGGVGRDSAADAPGKAAGPLAASINRLRVEHSRFFYRIGIDNALIVRSYDLTKLGEPVFNFELSTNGSEEKFDSKERFAAALATCLEQKNKCRWSMTQRNVSSTKVYFPNRETLVRFGVKGIGSYPYPANPEAMSQLAKALADDAELIGDYTDSL